MSDNNGIGQIVAQVVSQVLESNIPRIREELTARVLEAFPVHPTAITAAAGPDHLPQLLKSVSAIHAVAAQRDVLRTLLDNALHFCGRAALFVVKGTSVNGWQGRAFVDNDGVKDVVLDANSGLVGRALQSHSAATGSPDEMDHNFMSRFGGPVDGKCVVLPLLLKEKVAALIYADCGLETGGLLNVDALALLVLATGTWLEIASVRKSGTRESVPEASAAAAAAGAASQSTSSINDPFASHAPRHAAVAATAVADPAGHESGSGEGDVHKKAQRFARLLVDEIKLYNQAKVMEGRKNKDLYDRMKEDIDKSRTTYQKRYGNTAAGSADYFSQELVRSLAEDDASLLGNNFKR